MSEQRAEIMFTSIMVISQKKTDIQSSMKSSIFSTISDDVSNIAPRNFQQYLIWKYCTTRRRNYRFRNICFSLHGLALPWLLISFTVECLDLPLFFEAVL